jgi:5-methylcytosine-specific restriction endonuclease McrA
MVQVVKAFEQTTIKAVWSKGRVIDGYDAALWRRDLTGHAMKFTDYGDTNSTFGWEVDHIKPVARGGSDDITNLQPLYWENNRRKGDSYPWSWS